MSATYLLSKLEQMERDGAYIGVVVAGAGVMGKAICKTVGRTPGMRVVQVISSSSERAAACLDLMQHQNECAVAAPSFDRFAQDANIVIEVTGDVFRGAALTSRAIAAGLSVLSFSAETDAIFGPLFSRRARQQGVVYGFADGDQPGVLGRLFDECRLMGFKVRGIWNCKGFHDAHATPKTIASWVVKNCGTGTRMITSFTDGTKMSLEQNIIANVTGFLPLKRGMTGLQSTFATCAADIVEKMNFDGQNFVDYTLGGDFAGGVFVLIEDHDDFDSDHLRYYKAGGPGPYRIIYRPYHMCSFEVPRSIAEAYFMKHSVCVQRTIAARTIAVAKRDMPAGTVLDGIGGYDLYGLLDKESESKSCLPISLAEKTILCRDYKSDEPVLLADVEFTAVHDPLLALWNAPAEKPLIDRV